MFSGLPKLADKAFVIGYMVPVLLTVAAILAGFQECRWAAELTKTLDLATDLGKLTLFAAAVILAALLLMLVNRPIYRAVEGYIGPLSLGVFKDRARKAWRKMDKDLGDLRATAQTAAQGQARDAAVVAYRQALRNMRRRYPRTEAVVLPTRFGNANRAFETYAACVYDAEAILIWPRLSPILPKPMQDAITDARAQVNCFVNIAVLAALLAVARVLTWAGEGAWRFVKGPATPLGTFSLSSLCVGAAGVLLLVLCAAMAYRMAVERALALGDEIKVAFDLYLPQLPAKLGYVFPGDAAGRKAFWAALEEAFSFHNPVKGVAYAPPQPVQPAAKVQDKDNGGDGEPEDDG